MPENMEGQEQEQTQEQTQGQEQGSPMEVLQGIHQGLMILMDMMQKSKSVSDQDKQALMQIVQAFRSFAQSLGGQNQGRQAEETTTPEQGASEAIPMG